MIKTISQKNKINELNQINFDDNNNSEEKSWPYTTIQREYFLFKKSNVLTFEIYNLFQRKKKKKN